MRSTIVSLHESDDVALHAATVMPDHVHLLFTLGERLQLSQVIAKFKTLTRRQGFVDWRWQDNGYEHHLRPSESLEGFGFYIFMNPYAAKLCALAAEWPWWVCPEPTEFAFLASLNDGQVPPEWLSRYQQLSSTLPVGE